jgi:hypothetical protein
MDYAIVMTFLKFDPCDWFCAGGSHIYMKVPPPGILSMISKGASVIF